MFGKNNESLISIVIPVFNAEEHLEVSLCSVLEQSYKNLEIICVDDGSTDQSSEILHRIKLSDERLIIMTQENQGAGVARNRGMEVAKGEYIYFFDSDDFLNKKAIQTLVKTAERNNTDIVLFGYYKFFEGKKICVDFSPKTLKVPIGKVINPERISDRLFQADHGMPWNKFYNADFLRHSKVQFQQLKNTNDEFFSRITTVEAKRILFLNKEFVGYRVGNKNSIQGKSPNNILDCTKAMSAIFDELQSRGCYDTYAETFKKWVGYVIILKLLAVKNTDAFDILSNEIIEHILQYYEIEEKDFEECYKDIFRALNERDLKRAKLEINRIG